MSTESAPETVTTRPDAGADTFVGRHWQKLLAALLWVLLLGGYGWYYSRNNLTPSAAFTQIIELLQSPWGPLLYILIYAVRPLFFFSAVVITLAGGAVFGAGGSPLNVAYAVLLTIIASNTSATVAYLVGRFFGEGLLRADDPDSASIVERYTSRMRGNSFETIMIMRFIFLPYDLVNYMAGILRIKYLPFILATALGSIPGTIAFVSFGASVDITDLAQGQVPAFNPWVLAFGAMIFVVSIAISRVFKAREAKRAAAGE
ncbi:MAG: TVP38/TMEM64 family protein [Anaerolineae bacterium]